GLVGSRHARFSNFVRGPAAVLRDVRGLLRGTPERHVGHNPVGALAILALLGLTLAIGASGWARFNDIGGEALAEFHEIAAVIMLTVVGVHVAGVVLASRLHRENLVAAMIHGRKEGPRQDGIRTAWRSVGVLMVAVVLAFWAWQWSTAPSGMGLSPEEGVSAGSAARDDD
ncbi:MAG: cytochrome b/b6 domain-containing protein, partial [Burkholderiaceae bacterium]|nr:cytochrome b/b6 domain-containing protein [Burkholderiaceae bacterium]